MRSGDAHEIRLPRIAVTTAALMTLLAGSVAVRPAAAAAESAESIYTRALARERELRDGEQRRDAAANAAHRAARTSRWCGAIRRAATADNALWQAGNLALLAYERFARAGGQADGHSPVHAAQGRIPVQLAGARAPTAARRGRGRSCRAASRRRRCRRSRRAAAAPVPAQRRRRADRIRHDRFGAAGRHATRFASGRGSGRRPAVTIRDIKRTALPDGIRVTIEMDRESIFRAERLDNPRRVFFDLKGRADGSGAPGRDARSSRTTSSARSGWGVIPGTRRASSWTWSRRRATASSRSTIRSASSSTSSVCGGRHPLPRAGGRADDRDSAAASQRSTAPSRRRSPRSNEPRPPAVARSTVPVGCRRRRRPPRTPTGSSRCRASSGSGVSRIVLDAGHGGHDPGARANGVNESELVLDVALRLRKLLEKQPGIEVVMTREATSSFRSKSGRRSPTARARICSCRFTPTPAGTPRRAASRPTS